MILVFGLGLSLFGLEATVLTISEGALGDYFMDFPLAESIR